MINYVPTKLFQLEKPIDVFANILDQIIDTITNPRISQEILERFFEIGDSHVLEVLSKDQKLAEFLVNEAYNKIKEFFPESKLVLRCYRDPETDDDTLTLHIVVSMDPNEAFEALKKFDEMWWLHKAPEYSNLCIHLQLT